MNYFEIKKYVKNNICNLNDYSTNEEDLLIEETLNCSKEKIIIKDFSDKDIKKIDKIIKKRKEGKPLNKIFKRSYFYRNLFYINNHVLAPRQETEVVVETALKQIGKLNQQINILDLCCGSGVIGLSVLDQCKNANCTFVDISSNAINVAKKNAKILQLINSSKFIKSNLFNNLKVENKFDIILSNPPYIKSNEINTLSVGVRKYDPKIALDGGNDGLFFYREISKTCKKFLTPNGVVIVEIGYNQKKDVEKLFNDNCFTTYCIKDFSNNNRVIVAKIKKENKND